MSWQFVYASKASRSGAFHKLGQNKSIKKIPPPSLYWSFQLKLLKVHSGITHFITYTLGIVFWTAFCLSSSWHRFNWCWNQKFWSIMASQHHTFGADLSAAYPWCWVVCGHQTEDSEFIAKFKKAELCGMVNYPAWNSHETMRSLW